MFDSDDTGVSDRLAVLAVGLFCAGSLIAGPYPREQLLQHLPTVPALIFLDMASRRGWLSGPSIRCVLAFVVVHAVGARYIYSYVPYDELVTQVLSTSPSEAFGWERNHYDRLAHLVFGALFVLPFAEVARRHGKMSKRWALAFSAAAILAVSALYECFEWGLTIVLSPTQAESYNGQQGDIWDPQKDMAMAALGMLVALLPSSLSRQL